METTSALADACPRCFPGDHQPVPPHAVTGDGDGGMVADYECPVCGHRWTCGWDAGSAGWPASRTERAYQAGDGSRRRSGPGNGQRGRDR